MSFDPYKTFAHERQIEYGMIELIEISRDIGLCMEGVQQDVGVRGDKECGHR